MAGIEPIGGKYLRNLYVKIEGLPIGRSEHDHSGRKHLQKLLGLQPEGMD
jgi:hypothetical protein